MSGILVIHCDFDEGNCDEKIDGFVPWIDPDRLTAMLMERGWSEERTRDGSDDRHVCPKHTDPRKDSPNDT